MQRKTCFIIPTLAFSIIMSPFQANADVLNFEGCSFPPISVSPSKDTGLDYLYVLYNVQEAKIRIDSTNPANVKISQFSNLGGAFQTPVEDFIIDGNYIYIDVITPNSGYIIEENGKSKYIWIIDYSDYIFDVQSLYLSEDNSCDATVLEISGNAKPIHYYTINGRQETLSRDIELQYNTLVFDDNSKQFEEIELVKNIASITEKISIFPPVYCSSSFTLEGDRFLKEWNKKRTVKSQTYPPISTSVYTEAIIENSEEDSSNQINSGIEGLGGSAPCSIKFRAYVSDAVIHNEWQMASDESFEDITYRINEQDLDYTFTQEGTTYLRFVGSNNDGSCEAIGETFTVTIGTSVLKIPNAFSPNGDGINDEWKVSYRSLIDFKCWIFDRQGHEIISFDDPDVGWDGKRNGKYVNPGVYYYVIQAKGADGKHYKKSGDINIIKGSYFQQNQEGSQM